ncbi:TPA: DUF551 domain-containing protein [Enterobacter hormaechei subsp. hoffmannii]
MSTLTKEWLHQTIAELEEERDTVPGVVNEDATMALAAMRLALASLEAEAVAWIVHARTGDQLTTDGGYVANAEGILGLHSTPLYTAPPAPVSVPDEATPENIEILASTYAPRGITYQWDRDECNAAADSWNACRAAMLQGADQAPVKHPSSNSVLGWLRADYQNDNRGLRGNAPLFVLGKKDPSTVWGLDYIPLTSNSPVIPDGWVACSERMPGIGTEIFYFCQDDGLRDCGIVSSSNFSGKGDAELYVHAEGYDLHFGVDITHWMPLPAAPQQEVK